MGNIRSGNYGHVTPSNRGSVTMAASPSSLLEVGGSSVILNAPSLSLTSTSTLDIDANSLSLDAQNNIEMESFSGSITLTAASELNLVGVTSATDSVIFASGYGVGNQPLVPFI